MKRLKTFLGGILLLIAAVVLLILGISGWNMTRGTSLLYANPSFGGLWLSWPWLLLAGVVVGICGAVLVWIGWKSRTPKAAPAPEASMPVKEQKNEKICPVCGNSVNGNFCDKCGAKVS